MKRILYLTFYFEPDLCAGSFRNTPLAAELARQGMADDVEIDVVTTMPNRYSTFSATANKETLTGNLKVKRIDIPKHNSGLVDQIFSFYSYFRGALKYIKGKEYDLVFASSSRLFTAYLGYRVAKKRGLKLYLDIRDIFVDTIQDVLKSKAVRWVLLPILKAIEKRTFGYATHINLISGGFQPYFEHFRKSSRTHFTNGIDPIFLALENTVKDNSAREVKTIVYAGNIGEGQGLDKIVPQAARLLAGGYKFRIIGDGGAKKKLNEELGRHSATNVELMNPMSREMLVKEYLDADFLFIHLNDYEAFRKVLPSKIFELSVFNKPIVAGVGGYAHDFIKENLSGSILFAPGDYKSMVKQIKEIESMPTNTDRQGFISKYQRDNINARMAESILSYL